MQTFTKHFCAALVGVALLSSCSRPVAYFQRGPVVHYNTPKTEVASSVAVNEVVQPAETPATVSESPVVAAVTPAPAPQVAQAQAAVNQIEAYVRNDNKLSASKKLSKRMERVKSMLSSMSAKTVATTNTTTTAKKMNLMERIATKHINNKIKHQLAPDRTMATSMLTIGIIVAAAGLLLLLIGNGFGAVIGAIALVVGLVLIILELVRQ